MAFSSRGVALGPPAEGPTARALRRVGALPDKTITVLGTDDGVLVGSGGETAEIVPEAADHIFVRRL